MKQWSRKFNRCIQCKTTERKHHGNGLCYNCYYSTQKWKEYMKEYGKAYKRTLEYKKHRREYRATPERRAYQKEYRQRIEVKQRVKGYQKEWQKEKSRHNPGFRLNKNIRTAIWLALKGQKNGRQWERLVGYTLKELMAHLEKQFDENMSWDNYGSYWHVDHVLPISWFIYKTPNDIGFKMCWDLDNLQPLEVMANIKKNNRLIYNN